MTRGDLEEAACADLSKVRSRMPLTRRSIATAFSAPRGTTTSAWRFVGIYEFIKSGLHKLLIGPQDAVHVPPALRDVSPNTSCESDVGVRVHKNFQVHEIS